MSAPVHDPALTVAPPIGPGPAPALVKPAANPARRARTVALTGYAILAIGYIVCFFIPRAHHTVGHRVVMAVSFVLLLIGAATAIYGIVRKTIHEL